MTEHEELAGWLESHAEDCTELGRPDWVQFSRRAAALLREARPRWVPVAERPWERPGWCDAEGRCWWLVLNQSWPCLYLMRPNSALATDSATYSLPHWFILIPIEPTTPTETNG